MDKPRNEASRPQSPVPSGWGIIGEHPTSLDATACAFLANLIEVPLEMPVKVQPTGFANLVAYCGRMRERFFP